MEHDTTCYVCRESVSEHDKLECSVCSASIHVTCQHDLDLHSAPVFRRKPVTCHLGHVLKGARSVSRVPTGMSCGWRVFASDDELLHCRLQQAMTIGMFVLRTATLLFMYRSFVLPLAVLCLMAPRNGLSLLDVLVLVYDWVFTVGEFLMLLLFFATTAHLWLRFELSYKVVYRETVPREGLDKKAA